MATGERVWQKGDLAMFDGVEVKVLRAQGLFCDLEDDGGKVYKNMQLSNLKLRPHEARPAAADPATEYVDMCLQSLIQNRT